MYTQKLHLKLEFQVFKHFLKPPLIFPAGKEGKKAGISKLFEDKTFPYVNTGFRGLCINDYSTNFEHYGLTGLLEL